MRRSSLKEEGLIIEPMVAAHGNDEAQPDVAEHPDRLGMFLAAQPGARVVRLRPLAASDARKRELPQRLAQGMNAGPATMDRANGTAFPGDGCGTGLALGGTGIAIPVAIVAQFSDHPGGEKSCSAWQAVVELAVRMESQYSLNLPIVRIEVLRERLQLGYQRASQAGLGANERRRDVKPAGVHPRMNLRRPVPAMRTMMTTQERLELRCRDGLQRLAGRKGLQQRQGESGSNGRYNARSVRSSVARTHASRRSDLAPATRNRSRWRSTALGLMAYDRASRWPAWSRSRPSDNRRAQCQPTRIPTNSTGPTPRQRLEGTTRGVATASYHGGVPDASPYR